MLSAAWWTPLPLSRQSRRIFQFFSRDKACSRAAVDRVLRFLHGTQTLLTTTFSVRKEQPGVLVAAVRDGGDTAAGPVDSGLGESPAVVATAGQRIADGHHQAAVGVDDHLQVRGVVFHTGARFGPCSPGRATVLQGAHRFHASDATGYLQLKVGGGRGAHKIRRFRPSGCRKSTPNGSVCLPSARAATRST